MARSYTIALEEDASPQELRRVIEFLNQQMDPAEVLAVEIKQYVGEGQRTLVPTVLGQTAEAQKRKGLGSRGTRQWDEASFMEHLSSQRPRNEVEVASDILKWVTSHTSRIWWGKGQRAGSFVPVLDYNDTSHQLFAVWSSGSLEVYFYWYKYKQPFDAEARRLQLLEKFNAIPGVSLPADAIDRRPNMPLEVFVDDSNRHKLFETFEWYLKVIKES